MQVSMWQQYLKHPTGMVSAQRHSAPLGGEETRVTGFHCSG